MSKAKKQPLLKIPLDFRQTVLAALETRPEPRKKKHQKPKPTAKGGRGGSSESR